MDVREVHRLAKMSAWESELYRCGYAFPAGVDEAGRGPLAGPVVAAVVVFPKGLFIEGMRDSKQLAASQREKLYPIIKSEAVDSAVGIVQNEVIDQVNILQATRLAVRQALLGLKQAPDFLLTDALSLPDVPIDQFAVVRGDSLCHSIAAASVLAKVTRDRLMEEYHRIYPKYNFVAHKGYGTSEHLKLLRRYGPCPIHRASFKGVREI